MDEMDVYGFYVENWDYGDTYIQLWDPKGTMFEMTCSDSLQPWKVSVTLLNTDTDESCTTDIDDESSLWGFADKYYENISARREGKQLC